MRWADVSPASMSPASMRRCPRRLEALVHLLLRRWARAAPATGSVPAGDPGGGSGRPSLARGTGRASIPALGLAAALKLDQLRQHTAARNAAHRLDLAVGTGPTYRG